MKINLLRFNTVLLLVIMALAAGCQSLKKKDATTLRLHLEAAPRETIDETLNADIGREAMFSMKVKKEVFLDEGDVMKAATVNAAGGFQIMIQFNRHGSWILENFTTTYRGQRMGIYSEFGQARWLAAPTITRTIKDGVLVFTADVTKEEAERIVKGLNNVAKVMQKNNP